MRILLSRVFIAAACSTAGFAVLEEAIPQVQELAGVPAAAQVPNFSGHWTLQPDPTGGDIAAGGSGVVVERRPAQELTLTQDARTLTVSRIGPNGEVKTVFNLDGSDSKNGNLISNARWVGGKLVVVDRRDMGGAIVTRTVTWWMDGSALKMEVKTVENAANGGSATNEMVNIATYKKM